MPSKYYVETVAELLVELRKRGLSENGPCKDVHITRLYRDDRGLAQLNHSRVSTKTQYHSKSFANLILLKEKFRPELSIPDDSDKDAFVAAFVEDDHNLLHPNPNSASAAADEELPHAEADSDEEHEERVKSERLSPFDSASSPSRHSSVSVKIEKRSSSITSFSPSIENPLHSHSPKIPYRVASPGSYHDYLEAGPVRNTIEVNAAEDTTEAEAADDTLRVESPRPNTPDILPSAQSTTALNQSPLSNFERPYKRRADSPITPEPTPKKQRIMPNVVSPEEFSKLRRGPAVTILVGTEKVSYGIPQALALHFSPVLRAAFTGGFKETGEQTIHFEEDDPTAFDLIVEWMQSNGQAMTVPDTIVASNVDCIQFLLRVAQIADQLDLFGPCSQYLAWRIKSVLLCDPEALSSAHIQAASELPARHEARQLLMDIVAYDYIFYDESSGFEFKFQKELEKNASDILPAVKKLMAKREREHLARGRAPLASFVRHPLTRRGVFL